MSRVLLLRYDVEAGPEEPTEGFLEKAVEVHRSDAVPCCLFCTGTTLERQEPLFKSFWREVKGDPLFDVQDHSYSRIPLCYEKGPSLESIRADYERSVKLHKRVFGKRPLATSLCASQNCGQGLPGFDANGNSRAELAILAELGFKMCSTALSGHVRMHDFVSFAKAGQPEMMGFPSGNGDKNWLLKPATPDPLDALFAVISKAAAEDRHLGVVLHDWVSWNHAPDKLLTHVRRIASFARGKGFSLKTHSECFADGSLWR